MADCRGEGEPGGRADLPASFRLTDAFLNRHPRYRETLSLTPEHRRFDPVLWHSSIATLRGLLIDLAESEDLDITDEDLDRTITNLVEGIVRRAEEWPPDPPG